MGQLNAANAVCRTCAATEEGVCEKLLEAEPLHRVALQQPPQQAPAGGAQPGPHSLRQARLAALNVAQQLHVVRSSEGRLAHQQLIQDGANGPQVSLQAQVQQRRD